MRIPIFSNISLAALVLIPTVSIANNATPYHYNVHIPENLQHFNVEICFTNPHSTATRFTLDTTSKQFTNIRRILNTNIHPVSNEQIKNGLTDFSKGECIAYEAPFHGAITYPRYKTRQYVKDQILVTLSQWLWRPATQENTPLTINYYLPAQFEVSSPGQLISTTTGRRTYLLSARPEDWGGRVAIGKFNSITREKKDSRINIAILNKLSESNRYKIIRWVDANLSALYQVYNELPVKDLQIFVVPIGSAKEPVPWGQVMRGGGDAVHLYIDETRPLQEFLDDWVLIHELSHLLHPRLSVEGKWLSEGLASYYQNVLLARSGLLSANQAWGKMNAGFKRGMKGTSTKQTLIQDSETMMRNRAFMRVYWSGAAISLMLDTRIRNATHNKKSLDSVLHKFKNCCLPMPKQWSALTFMQKLDELSETPIFTQLYNEHAFSNHFPDLTKTYLSLGLTANGDKIHLDNKAKDLNTRRQIMQKKIH